MSSAPLPPAERGGRGLFLDRDGTLIVDKVYLSDPAGVEIIPGAAEGLKRARALGYRLFLFTNQSGIGRGYHTQEDTQRVNARMIELLGMGPDLFDAICIAPEAPDQPSLYRKPSPRFITEMLARHGLQASRCWMVGDSTADIGAALAAGIHAAAVRTGRVDPQSIAEVAAGRVPVFADFGAFAAGLT
ncbi:MAG TPA: HAD-IIIA family hydrolase [Opitutaceae bacterium]|jgi:D-glycero-D-manno-heptose 1,7-bisphosphate phosphatase|nr:HAD-IIIA family hydrolase [Opitutaceae bacterium]